MEMVELVFVEKNKVMVRYLIIIYLEITFDRGPTAAAWTTGGIISLCFVTDWRAVLQYVPYVRGRFPPIESNTGEEDS